MPSFMKAGALVLLLAASLAHAQVAQEPLLNRASRVQPNLTLVLDDSGSMNETNIYEYGKPDGLGPRGPGSGIYGPRSPDVNRLYYDPRVSYKPRPNFDGSPLPVGPIVNTWSVYFRKTTGPYNHGELTAASDYHDPYIPPAALVVPGSTASYPVNVTAGTPVFTEFPKFMDRTDCTGLPHACTLAEERLNHTIWKKWYASRIDMAKTGIALAFQSVKGDAIRLGFGTITDLGKGDKLARGVASYSEDPGGTKHKFFDWLYGVNTKGGTPNIKAVFNAGRYHERTDSDGPWGTTPDPDSIDVDKAKKAKSPEPVEDHATCRRSFSMLVTDGYWNDTVTERKTGRMKKEAEVSWSIKREGKADYVYVPKKPFKRGPSDKSENTLSDVAMHFWGRDLRPDLKNRVPELTTAAGKNESAWQNVSFYAVTLGLLGTLKRDTTTWARMNDPTDSLYWPEPVANSATTIDDTWHATTNARGELLNANNASELTRAMKRMLEGISGTPQSLAGVAVSSTEARAGLRKYKPEYISGSWSGNLTAIELDPMNGKELSAVWKVEDGVDLLGDPKTTIPVAALRNIVTWNGSTSVPFTAGNTSLDPDLVAYLRGDPSKELRKAGGIFRNRESRLGDIVNSAPVYVGDSVNLYYEALTGPDAPPAGSYKSFLAAKAARPGAIFVGANDGMLHGFADGDGVEKFAYVPQAVRSKLAQLADTPYQHQYFVDGPNVESDAYVGGQWTNLLVGTTGAGAKAVYAIDVTAPLAPKLMWEVNSSNAAYSQLGHVLSGVQTGMLRNGEWVAVFGNGFASSGGTARLYVVNLATGALLKEMAVGSGPNNGLGPVTLVHDAGRRIIGAYAGDLHGYLWKFDLTDTFKGGSALFEPTSPGHPITAAPAVLPHPKGGHMVTFGTGKFFEDSDKDPPYATERLYGVWDAKAFGANAVPVKGITQLTEQTVTTVKVGPVNFSRISSGHLTWGDGSSGVRGWYLTLPHPGQRLVYPIQRLPGTFVLATTLSPADDGTADICLQSGGGRAWSYIIDGVTGSGLQKPALDTDGNGVINTKDAIVSGFEHGVGGSLTRFGRGATRLVHKITFVGVGGGHLAGGGGSANGEFACGQIGTDDCPTSARQWRQIFPR